MRLAVDSPARTIRWNVQGGARGGTNPPRDHPSALGPRLAEYPQTPANAWSNRATRNDTLEVARSIRNDGDMSSIGIYEAKKHFSKLLRRAAAGEEIVITRSGNPVIRLVPISYERERQLGIDAGKFEIPDDFDNVMSLTLERRASSELSTRHEGIPMDAGPPVQAGCEHVDDLAR